MLIVWAGVGDSFQGKGGEKDAATAKQVDQIAKELAKLHAIEPQLISPIRNYLKPFALGFIAINGFFKQQNNETRYDHIPFIQFRFIIIKPAELLLPS
jgi:hypothetical protein